MNLLLAFIAFNVIIIVHELGHFIAAKKFGIKVLEFSLFVGPKLYSIQRGETTYSIRLFPIMAYVKMEGEEEASDNERAFNNQPRYARALTAFGGPLANLLIAVVLLTIVYSVQGFSTPGISKVESNSPAAAAGIQQGDKIVGYDGKKVYLPLDVVQFLYVSKGRSTEIEYIRDGERFQKNITPLVTPARTSYKIQATFNSETGKDSNVITSVVQGDPAQKAGLLAGDRIIKLNDTNIATRNDLVAFLEKCGGKEIKVTALRNGAELHVNLIPKAEKIPEQYDIGVEFVGVQGNVWESLKQSFVFTYSIVRSTGYTLVWLVTGEVSFNQMMGPIGMVDTIGTVVQQGQNLMIKLIYLLNITAYLSIAVGAFNLIPFPMLDGNRLLLIGIEAIRRKPIKPEREAFISMVGFVLLILLAIYVGYNDILRLVKG